MTTDLTAREEAERIVCGRDRTFMSLLGVRNPEQYEALEAATERLVGALAAVFERDDAERELAAARGSVESTAAAEVRVAAAKQSCREALSALREKQT